MAIKIEQAEEGKVVLGGTLNQEQKEALAGISIGANEIFERMDELNAGIEEASSASETPEDTPQVRKLPKVSVPKPPANLRQETQSGSTPGKKFDPHNRVKKSEGKKMNLDQELESMGKELNETKTDTATGTQDVQQDPGTMRSQIMDLLKNTPGAPSEAQINAWKAEHGEKGVHVMALGDEDVYIFTHLRRGQWKKIQEITAKAQQIGNTNLEDDLKERVIQYSVLWPHPLPAEFLYNSRAGVVDSLYEVILLNSYFLSPQQAIMLTTQL